MGRWRFLAAVFTTIGLAGCDRLGLEMPEFALSDLAKISVFGGTQKPVSAQLLLTGDVIAAGPTGYCADTNASRIKSGFGIFGPCVILGKRDAAPAISAVYTVQVGAAESAIIDANGAGFAEFLRSPRGAASLARDGSSDTVQVREVIGSGPTVTVALRHSSEALLAGAHALEWRAFMDVNGRLVTLAVRGLDENPLPDSAGAFLLEQAVEAMKIANTDNSDTES